MYLSNYLPEYLFSKNLQPENGDAFQSYSTTEFIKKKDGTLQTLYDNTHGKLNCEKSKEEEKIVFRYSSPIKIEKKPCPCMTNKKQEEISPPLS